MRDLVLVFPDGCSSERAAVSSEAAAWTALRFGIPRALTGGWRAMLARGFGREELAWFAPASLLGAAHDLESDVWIATPLHWQAGLTTVHLPADGVLRLADEEAQAWARAFAEVFGSRGLGLVPAGSAGFLLRGLGDELGDELSDDEKPPLAAETIAPATLWRLPLAEAQPRGPGSRRLRALMAEIELWLHAAPLNLARRERGVPPISSLWLWGGGAPPRDPPSRHAGSCRWDRVFADEAGVRALGRLAAVPIAGVPTNVDALLELADESVCVVVDSGAFGVLAQDAWGLDRRCLAPAARALAEGRLARLTLVGPDRAVAVSASDRYRFWRPRRSWIAALEELAA